MKLFLFIVVFLSHCVLSRKINLEKIKFEGNHKRSEDQLPPQLPYAYPLLPLSGVTLPTLTRDYHVLVIGKKGIAGAIATKLYDLGASVTATTLNKTLYDLNPTLPSGIEVVEMDKAIPCFHDVNETELKTSPGNMKYILRYWKLIFGRDIDIRTICPDISPHKVIKKYIERMGYIDLIIDTGVTVTAGYLEDYNDLQMDYSTRMYQGSSISIERAIKKFNPPGRPVTHFMTSSMASRASTPGVQDIYDTGFYFRWLRLISGNVAMSTPNYTFVSVACTFANTTWFLDSINPSANRGDAASVAFQKNLAAATPIYGTPLSTMAEAYAQAILLRTTLLNNETFFMVDPLFVGHVGTFYLHYIEQMLSALNYTNAYYSYLLSNFAIDLHNHTKVPYNQSAL